MIGIVEESLEPENRTGSMIAIVRLHNNATAKITIEVNKRTLRINSLLWESSPVERGVRIFFTRKVFILQKSHTQI